MPEELHLDTAHQASSGTNRYLIKSLTIVLRDNRLAPSWQWTVELVGDNETLLTYTETNPARAELDLKALNTANLALKSLQRRLLEAVQARMTLPTGTIVGTPD